MWEDGEEDGEEEAGQPLVQDGRGIATAWVGDTALADPHEVWGDEAGEEDVDPGRDDDDEEDGRRSSRWLAKGGLGDDIVMGFVDEVLGWATQACVK